jgi:AbiU2
MEPSRQTVLCDHVAAARGSFGTLDRPKQGTSAMSESKNADEVRQSYINAMGTDLGELFHVVAGSLTWMHWRWKQYRTLFADNPERIAALNQAAPFFFRVVQDLLFEDVLLAIARLVGPPKSAGRPNVCVERLLGLVPQGPLHGEVATLVAKAKQEGAFAVEWRNRHLAHRDLDTALGKAVQPLPEANRTKVEAALAALRAVLNRLQREYCNATTAYDWAITTGDAESLLYVIRDGLLRQADRETRWHQGQQHDDDINPPKAI